MPARATLDIYGLTVNVRAPSLSLLNMTLEDLRDFRLARPRTQADVEIRLQCPPEEEIPGEFARPEFRRREWTVSYGRYLLRVRHRQKSVEASFYPASCLWPDPGYCYVFTQPLRRFLKQRGLFFLHGGCVALHEGGPGLLIVGHPHAGKSVLSVTAARGGLKVLGDEQPLLRLRDGQVEALAVHRRIRLDKDVALHFPELRRLAARHPYERLAFHLRTFWPGQEGKRCIPRLIIFPRFERKSTMALEPMDLPSTLRALLTDENMDRNRPESDTRRKHERLLEVLAMQCRAFSLRYNMSHLSHIPQLFKDLLNA